MFWRVFILLALFAVNVALFFRMVWGPQGVIAYRNLKAQHVALEARLTELDRGNLALSREIRLLQTDDKYIEKMIRRRLHYVRDNEILYLFSESQFPTRSGAVSDAGKN